MSETLLVCSPVSALFLSLHETAVAPFIYGVHFFTLLLSTVIAVVLALRFGKIPLMRVLAFSLSLFSLWLFIDVVLWVEVDPSSLSFFWTGSMLIEPILNLTILYLVMIFLNGGKDITHRPKLAILLLAAPIFILTPTAFGVLGFDATDCQRDIVEGIAPYYTYLLALGIVAYIVFNTRQALRTEYATKKVYLKLFSGLSVSFILLFSGSNAIGSLTGYWDLAQIVMFAMPLVIIAILYTANRYLPDETA